MSGLSRRGFLGAASAATAALGITGLTVAHYGSQSDPTGKVLTSRLPLPRPFQVPLPRPRTAVPVSTHGADHYRVVQRPAAVEIIPGHKTTVWGFDGTFPGPTFAARSGRAVKLTVANSLPVPTSTHLHGGVTPPESDGYPTDLLHPVGHAARHAPAMPGMSMGDTGGTATGERTYTYPLDQPAATLWYHDHRMDFTGPQIWRGLVGLFLVQDDTEQALHLPRGEQDVPLVLCDRSFEEDGSFRYPSIDPTLTRTPGVTSRYTDGVLGDVQLVNGAPWPVLEVAATTYRLRLLNASNARRYRLALRTPDGHGLPLTQIASDLGLLARPQPLDEVTITPAERFEFVVDFSQLAPGTEVTLVNTLASGPMGKVMRFRVTRRSRDVPPVPATLADLERLRPAQAVTTRRFDFRMGPDGMWTINGRPFSPSGNWASPRLGTVERWRLTSDFHHPVHLHLARFQVLSRDGRGPEPEDAGWKDTVDVRPWEVVEVLARFEGYRGRYMLHCHNIEHEDMAMMANFQVV